MKKVTLLFAISILSFSASTAKSSLKLDINPTDEKRYDMSVEFLEKYDKQFNLKN